MRKVQLVDISTKITSRDNSSNLSTKREISKNLEEKINYIKNLKKLFLSSSKLIGKNNSNINIINTKTARNEELNIKNALQKKKKFNFTTNKFYHSSLASISYSPKIFNKKRIKNEKNEKNKGKEKIIFLKLNNKNYRDVIKNNIIKQDKHKKEDKKININSTNFSTNNENIISIPSLTKNKVEKIEKKIKKSFSNNEINYIDYIHFIQKKNLKLNNIRKRKKENISYISSNAITNELLLNKYENKKTPKINNYLQIYSFKDIINDLTRNINLVNISHSNEFNNLQLLRNLDEKIKFPNLTNTYREYQSKKNNDREIVNINNNNNINNFNNINNKNINNNNIKEISEEKLIDPDEDTINNLNLNIKEILSLDDNQDDYQINQSGNRNKFYYKINLNNINNINNNKVFIKEEKEKEKEENDIKEDLKILGDSNSNKINWQLISKEDMQKGRRVWRKILKITKDFGMNYNMNKDNKIDDLNNSNELIKPKRNLSIKNIIFPEEKPRKTIVIKQKKELEPIKINNASSITSNNIFKSDTKFNLNEKTYNKQNLENNKEKISNNSKIKRKINYNFSPKVKLKKLKNKEDQKSENPLDIIKEETKTNNDNNQIKENENNKESKPKKNIKYDKALRDRINQLLENPSLFYSQRIKKENIEEKKEEEKKEEENKEEEKKEEEKNENKKEEKKEKEKKEIKYKKEEKKSEVQDISIFQRDEYNHQLMLNHLKTRKKSKKIKPSIYSFLNDLRNKRPSNLQNSEKKKYRKYFNDIDENSIKEIKKRKLEILFKFKHDLNFKIMKGDIKSNELFELEDLEQKINLIEIQIRDSNDTNKYVDILEEFFTAFENDIILAENKKKFEERINGFRNDLIDHMDLAESTREGKEKKFGSAIDFNIVNHINELSLLDKSENLKKLE